MIGLMEGRVFVYEVEGEGPAEWGAGMGGKGRAPNADVPKTRFADAPETRDVDAPIIIDVLAAYQGQISLSEEVLDILRVSKGDHAAFFSTGAPLFKTPSGERRLRWFYPRRGLLLKGSISPSCSR
ncbi:MAG: hypothetical protein LBR53_11310 [Deltaproteobacteria bacterium]|jgi:hypothetical protein|nr:hypothetical protein [Deltaproteobacteria bacterium]